MVTIRKVVFLLSQERRSRWVLLVVIALVASGFEVVGAALIYLLLALVADPAGDIALPVVGDIRTLVDVEPDVLMLWLAGLMAVFFLVRAVVHVGEIYLQQRVAHNAGAALASNLVRGYLAMPYTFHLSRTSSDLIRNSNQTVRDLVVQVFVPAIRVVAETIMVTGMLLLLIVLAPVATALAVVIIGGAALTMLRIVQPRLRRLGERAHELDERTLTILQQSLHGFRDITLLGREAHFVERYRSARANLARAWYLRATATDLPKTIMELALLGFILVVFAASIVLEGGSQGTLSVLGLFAYAGLRLQPSLQRIITGLNNLKYSAAPLEAVEADLRLVEARRIAAPASSRLPLRSHLRLEAVTFAYEGGHRNALEGIDLVVGRGEVLGICGPTGGGKTTMVDVMTGLLEPSSGQVRVDDVDVSDRRLEWQANLGVVPQMVFLTDESLRENIALGVPGEQIDEPAVQEAVDLAQLRPFIDSLPSGLDTVVGERGVRISGGQRQRVAIARALYRRPAVLVFDEGTSALDNTTERELMSAISRLRGDRTVVIIAHRLTTVRDADQIVVLEDGKITGRGTYDRLIQESAAFRQLASN
jgi:ATP-binding cassette, subfamily B, bacterial PglK